MGRIGRDGLVGCQLVARYSTGSSRHSRDSAPAPRRAVGSLPKSKTR